MPDAVLNRLYCHGLHTENMHVAHHPSKVPKGLKTTQACMQGSLMHTGNCTWQGIINRVAQAAVHLPFTRVLQKACYAWRERGAHMCKGISKRLVGEVVTSPLILMRPVSILRACW